ncbi:Chromosomal replication initiator protein DnaA [Rhodovastum atsumiense]|uniref:chromosomal replication initiator DnaA n=1 Tax=Rhodovastum atsumiense TaxID=504468 RepID=UPI00193B1FC0|nr:chromosomal replication initiator DnaA [Rhodovastum atsumiense]CAH2601591.1 Chromosomal replication initiator protein DnaA [Rhodovastum atsumiense]
MNRMPRQLALPFPHPPHHGAADFLPAGSNLAALEWLRSIGAWPQGRLALWGPEGCGKTHLLTVWAARHHGALVAGSLLSRAAAEGPPRRPVAVDDADTAPERPLLHLLNAAAEARLPVLLAGRAPPARWEVGLPDLASRLRAITAVEIGPPEDELLRRLLQLLLAEHQLAVPEPVQETLLLHLPRAQGAVREAVARLDHAALAAGGRVTRALALAVAASIDPEVAGTLPSHDVLSHSAEPASRDGIRLL